MKRCGVIQFVLDRHSNRIAFVKKQGWSPKFAVVDAARNRLITRSHLRKRVFDSEVKISSRKRIGNP